MASTGCCCLDSELLDYRGLKCPLPVLKLEKRLATAAPGARFVCLATDPVARIDIPLYCRQQGHACDSIGAADVWRFEIVVRQATATSTAPAAG